MNEQCEQMSEWRIESLSAYIPISTGSESQCFDRNKERRGKKGERRGERGKIQISKDGQRLRVMTN